MNDLLFLSTTCVLSSVEKTANMSLTNILWLLGLSLALLPSACYASASAPSVTLEAGVIVATTSTAPGSTITVKQFLGVPFAAKPLRFDMPEAPAKWTKPLKTNEQAPSCVQQLLVL